MLTSILVSYTNKINKAIQVNYKKNIYNIYSPTEFLSGDKNKIYNNGVWKYLKKKK